MPSQSEPAQGALVEVEQPSLLNIIAKAARDKDVDIAKLTALIALQERVAANQALNEYLSDLSRVAAEIEPVRKDATNPTFGKRYATLAAMDAALRPVYSRHGFSVSYGTPPTNGGLIGVTCRVAHRGGHIETLSLTAPPDTTTGGRARTPIQAVGSTISYLKRYLLGMAFSVTFAEEDDDGEGSRQQPPPPRRPSPPPRAESPPLVTPAPPPRRPPPPPAPEPAPQGDFLPDGEQLSYRLANANGGKAFATGSEWIAEWRAIIATCKQNDKLDRLQVGLDMNEREIAEVAGFDPLAAAEVRSMLASALSAIPSQEEMARTGK